ncbi:DoxX family protein [Qipengyuania atrilutea]|uniref:DoxX family protein n=1 Tax=Qipengyuania atrilutea TaxID=2744473 RepID=A0A850H1G4_9SPHN|nr:DoxX family protein [Actirhodobacter atriluteus]NVD45814.1 DoxX family protein [Actirhodobacter atriluteus]
MNWREISRWLLVIFYGAAGVLHLAMPGPFLSIMPSFVPAPEIVVALTGIAEILGAAGLAQPWSRRYRAAAGIGLAVYALCVWPANVNHLLIDLAKPSGGPNLAYHVPRMFVQPLLIWLALWAGGATDWPFRRR